MTAPQAHRLSLLLALTGALMMIAAGLVRLAPAPACAHPHFDSARPALPDWPVHEKAQDRA